MVQDPSTLQAYYASRAGEYDQIYAKPERQCDLREIEQWLPSRLATTRVLEIACGTGYWTRFIAAVAKSVVAIDSAPETLAIAQARVSADTVAFRVGDAYALAKDEEGFGAAFAGFWFSHVPLQRQRGFLAGLNAVLAPGSRVVLLDNLWIEGSSTPISERDAAGNTYQSRQLADGSLHRVLKNFPTQDDLLALANSGLGESAAWRCWDHYWAFEYRVPEPG